MLLTIFILFGLIAGCTYKISVRDNNVYNCRLDNNLGEVDHEIDIFNVQSSFQIIESSAGKYGSHQITIMNPSRSRQLCNTQIATR